MALAVAPATDKDNSVKQEAMFSSSSAFSHDLGVGTSASQGVSASDLVIDPSRESQLQRSTSAEAAPGGGGPEGTGQPEKKRRKVVRPVWSCTYCISRKIKCDKIVPCGQCIKRGKAATCHLQQEDPSLPGQPKTEDTTGALVPFPSTLPQQQQGQRETGTQLATADEYLAIRQSVSALGQRMHHLENLVARFVPVPNPEGDGTTMYEIRAGPPPSSRPALPAPSLPISHQIHQHQHSRTVAPGTPEAGGEGTGGRWDEHDSDFEAAVLLEFSALGKNRHQVGHQVGDGRMRNLDYSGVRRLEHANEYQPSPLSQFTSADARTPAGYKKPPFVPDRETSDIFVRFSLERVSWHHGAIHGGRFLAECAEFHSLGPDRFALANPQWLALYWAILAVAVRHMMDVATAQVCKMTPEEARELPKLFFGNAISNLQRGEFLTKASLNSVQMVVILVTSCYDVGPPDLMSSLLSCAIHIARHLGLHRLGPDDVWEQEQNKEGINRFSPIGINNLIDRELGKRLWWSLAIEDWSSVPLQRSYAIAPGQISTPVPTNCHDEDLGAGRLVARPMDEPTIATKIILWHNIAQIVRRFFDELTTPSTTSYEHCMRADRELRAIMDNAPAFLSFSSDISSFPPFVSWLRHTWQTSVWHKLLIVHRPFLGKSMASKQFAYSREVAVDSSQKILELLSHVANPPFMWSLPYHAVSAASVLVLDLFQSSTSTEDEMERKRAAVASAIEELKQLASHDSFVAQRGVALLSGLLVEERTRRRTNHPGGTGTVAPGAMHQSAPPQPRVSEFSRVAKKVSSGTGAAGTGSQTTSPVNHGPYSASPAGTVGTMPTPTASTTFDYQQFPTLSSGETQDLLDGLFPDSSLYDPQSVGVNLDLSSLDFWTSVMNAEPWAPTDISAI